MKIAELKELSTEELQAKADDLVEESFNLRFQQTMRQLTSPIRRRHVRRDIARIRTVLRERELNAKKI